MKSKKWKWIRGFKGFYKVSTRGRVKSVDRVITQTKSGTTYQRKIRGRVLNLNSGSNGRPFVALSKPGCRTIYKYVHKLVLETFVGPCPPGKEACHKDDNGWNNRKSNLYYGTRKQNCEDARLNGCVSHHRLTKKQVIKIRRIWERHGSERGLQSELSRRFGVHRRTIIRIVKGIHYRWAVE